MLDAQSGGLPCWFSAKPRCVSGHEGHPQALRPIPTRGLAPAHPQLLHTTRTLSNQREAGAREGALQPCHTYPEEEEAVILTSPVWGTNEIC